MQDIVEQDIVEGPTLAALSCGRPVYLVALLHGPGDTGQAMIDLAINWAPTMPKAEFLVAEAPFEWRGGRRWFDPEDADGPDAIAPALDKFLERALEKRRLPGGHLALVGFSQGATLALHVGLRRKEQPAAIVAFSAGFSISPSLATEIRSKPPALLIHGVDDPVAPIARMRDAKAALRAVGAPVAAFERAGLGHAIDDDGVLAAGDFLTKHVAHLRSAAREAGDAH
jgi:phospholipase/carboxylesterase